MAEPLIARLICVVFAAFAAYAILRTRRSLLGDEHELFSRSAEQCSPEIRERILDAVDRRQNQEHLAAWPAWLAAAALAVLCALVLGGWVSSRVGLALQEVVLVGAMSFQVLGARRASSTRRAASLRPRSAQNVVRPALWWFLAFALIWSGASIFFVDRANVGAFAVIASAMAFAVAVALYAVRMPAVVGDDDPLADELVDRRVRGARIGMLLGSAAAAPILLIYPALGDDVVIRFLHLLMAACIGFYALYATRVARVSNDDLSELVHGS